MKKLFFALSLAALLLTLSCSRYETTSGDPLGTKVYTLDNGLKVYMSVNRETPRIQTYIAVKVGGKNDPGETTGLAHYFEHLMFKGTTHFGTSDYEAEKPMLDAIEQLFETYRVTSDPAERAAIYHKIDSISFEASKISIPNEYDKLMSMIGADGTNAWTSQDETVYTEDIPSNQIDNWARIQADRFRNTVVRGFHTELETIYEEKNMSLTRDSRKMWEALYSGLFPNHPYGQQTVLGTQEHLKNPSITNVKKYHDTYYVPNNIAICVAGDFNPDEMVAAIEKYFGDWEPNPSIPQLQFEKEKPIESPVIKEVYGLEAENIALGWVLPEAKDISNTAIAMVASNVIHNGQAGLIDLDVNQQQKMLGAYAGCETQPDYGMFMALGYPKAGQSLDQVRDILLEEVAKLRNGDFDEELLAAVVNNLRLEKMGALESNEARAHMYVDAFISGVDWKVMVKELDYLQAVTKEDIVRWANEFLGEKSYVAVYKRQGEDKTVQKISAPKITPIESNRNMQSDFLSEIASAKVKPIEPVFVDFKKEMSQFNIADNANVLYKQNLTNDLFNIEFTFNTGYVQNPALQLAVDYVNYLGTPTMSAEQIASRMYALGCSFNTYTTAYSTVLALSGLSENMGEAISIAEDLIFNAVPDETILANAKADAIKSRGDALKSQRSCFSALQRYATLGGDFIANTTISNAKLMSLSSQELLELVRKTYSYGHEILYYGPMTREQLEETLSASHTVNPDGEVMPEVHPEYAATSANEVLMAQYDAKQIYYLQYSSYDKLYSPENEAAMNLYNEYFGGGMNTIVFQEMREARGLAYSAWARLMSPSYNDEPYRYMAFIATQNDKMRIAIEAFDEIINNMPLSEAAFSIAKEGYISRLRTDRINNKAVLYAYRDCRRLGLEEPLAKTVFEAVQNMTLEDVAAFQQEWVKGLNYKYAILGDVKDLDTKFLSTLGPVKVLSQKDIFGY